MAPRHRAGVGRNVLRDAPYRAGARRLQPHLHGVCSAGSAPGESPAAGMTTGPFQRGHRTSSMGYRTLSTGLPGAFNGVTGPFQRGYRTLQRGCRTLSMGLPGAFDGAAGPFNGAAGRFQWGCRTLQRGCRTLSMGMSDAFDGAAGLFPCGDRTLASCLESAKKTTRVD
jgi:hypothetical protein